MQVGQVLKGLKGFENVQIICCVCHHHHQNTKGGKSFAKNVGQPFSGLVKSVTGAVKLNTLIRLIRLIMFAVTHLFINSTHVPHL